MWSIFATGYLSPSLKWLALFWSRVYSLLSVITTSESESGQLLIKKKKRERGKEKKMKSLLPLNTSIQSLIDCLNFTPALQTARSEEGGLFGRFICQLKGISCTKMHRAIISENTHFPLPPPISFQEDGVLNK